MVSTPTYLCIDLKSFYASVECVERGLDPMTTRLVVADPERSEKTICLAVSPAMKQLGVRNRCRVFEIPASIDYITAPPRMQKYIDYAADIYGVYLKYISPEDIHVYSIDEAFLDVTRYLATYRLTPREMALRLMGDVLDTVGVRATCGIGTNLYLTKVALDITAKHAADFIGYLDEATYRRTLWDHQPLTDFWRIGRGISQHLARYGLTTMRGITQTDEDFLYREFGVDAELLIDHAWGREPTTIADIKAFRPKQRGLSSGQVLMRDYSFEEGCLIVREMMDQLCLDLVAKRLVTASVSIMIGYSNALTLPAAKGTASLAKPGSADTVLLPAVEALYRAVVRPDLPIRRLCISCNDVTDERAAPIEQLSLFDALAPADDRINRSRQVQSAVLDIKHRFGRDAIFRGMDLEDAATARARNHQIGGHKSGD